MSLEAQLAALRGQIENDLPDVYGRLQTEAAALRASGALRAALKAGDVAPDFRLRDGQGVLLQLRSLLRTGPVVICFYRGQWCQFCSLELHALGEINDEVRVLGASLVAIAPRAVAAQRLIEDVVPSFPLLVDIGAKVAKNFGLAFTPARHLQDDYRALGWPDDGSCHTALPIPATYVVDTSGEIVFSHLDSDFTSRLEPVEILAALRRLCTTRTAFAISKMPISTERAGRRF